MKYLFILNDPPYGTERRYSCLRLANALAKTETNAITAFLIGDAASCAAGCWISNRGSPPWTRFELLRRETGSTRTSHSLSDQWHPPEICTASTLGAQVWTHLELGQRAEG
jgi:DsrE/DsrF/DsrH-like protein